MWTEGSLRIGTSVFHYWTKHFNKPSQFGIDGGRVSKLMLKRYCGGHPVGCGSPTPEFRAVTGKKNGVLYLNELK